MFHPPQQLLARHSILLGQSRLDFLAHSAFHEAPVFGASRAARDAEELPIQDEGFQPQAITYSISANAIGMQADLKIVEQFSFTIHLGMHLVAFHASCPLVFSLILPGKH